MFILRKITGEGNELNFALGDQYSVILKDQNQKEFMRTMELPGYSAFKDDLYGFVVYGNGEIQMLFKKQRNYIMTETGKTFKNITDLALERSNKEYISEMDKRRENTLKEPVEEPVKGFTDLPSHAPGFYLAFGINEFPSRDESNEDISIDVLIDLDGYRKNFRVGYYAFGYEGVKGTWVCYDSESEITEHMKWMNILPLASKDNK